MPPVTSDENQRIIVNSQLRQQFLDILVKNGIKRQVEEIIMTAPKELKGEHFVADTVYVKVIFKDEEDKNLFVKMFGSMSSGEWAREMKLMDKEAEFFNVLLPQMRTFCGKYKGCQNILNFFPECLYADKEMVVLDNLVLNRGYIMLDKDVKQDLLTARFALEHLAIFHATNFAFILEEFGGIKNFGDNPKWALVRQESLFPEDSAVMAKGMIDDALGICINILKINPIEGSEKAIQIFESVTKNSHVMVKSLLGYNPKEPLQVINHGDFQNNNMLFRKPNDKVTDMMFIDMQLTRFGSPTLDIGYYLWTSVQTKIREANIEELLQYYFQKFEEILKAFGKTVPISFEQFYDEYRNKCDLGWIMGLNFLIAAGVMKEVDMESLSTDLEEMNNQWTFAINEWVIKNPEKSAKLAEEIVAFVNEREILQRRK